MHPITRTVLVASALAALALPPAALAADPAPGDGEPARAGEERHDLAALADGETRVFGAGDRAVTATRSGDEVTVTFGREGSRRTLTCTIGEDSCFVTTHDGRERTTVLLRKEGDGRLEEDVFVMGAGDGGERVFSWSASGDAGDPEAQGSRVHVAVTGPDELVLRCPRGDTTMRLGKDDEGARYVCPKHGVPLEKGAAGRRVIRRRVVEREEREPAAGK